MSAPETASVLILSSGFLHAIVNSLLKAGKDKLSGRALIDGFSALLVAPLALVTPFPTGAWNWLALAWLVRLLYLVSLVNAFQHLDLLVAYPIARGVAPLLAAAVAVAFFHEAISGAVLCGALLVSFGILAIGGARGVDRRGLGWSLLNGGCVALYTVVDAQGVRAAPSAESYIVWTFIGLGCGVSGVFALWRGPALPGRCGRAVAAWAGRGSALRPQLWRRLGGFSSRRDAAIGFPARDLDSFCDPDRRRVSRREADEGTRARHWRDRRWRSDSAVSALRDDGAAQSHKRRQNSQIIYRDAAALRPLASELH